MIKTTGWFIFFLLLAVACLDQPECFSLNNNIIGISFRKLSDNKADTVFFHTITADGTDSVFRTDNLMNGLDLPLNFYKDTTTYYFDGLNGADSIRLNYSARTQFVSAECGERFVLENLRILSHSFDSIRVLNTTPKANRSVGTNLEIYRCPNTSSIKIRFSAEVTITSITTDYPTAILFTSETIETINIPLNTASSASAIQFEFSDGTSKQLSLAYNRTMQTLFSVCGPQTILSDFEVLSTTFSTVEVKRNTIQDPPLTNLEITL